MKSFEIKKTIMLGFFNGREQYDRLINPGEGHLEFDECDIYWVHDGQRRISETMNYALQLWLDDGSISLFT